MTSRILWMVLLLAACRDSQGATAPTTRTDAERRFDAAINALNWAQVDLYQLGGRDIVVSVQLDSNLAPHYFRLPRQGAR